jgi:hypothetical protein
LTIGLFFDKILSMTEAPRPPEGATQNPYCWIRPEVRKTVSEVLRSRGDHGFVADEIKNQYIEEAFDDALKLNEQVVSLLTSLDTLNQFLENANGVKNSFRRRGLGMVVDELTDDVLSLASQADEASHKARLLEESRYLKYKGYPEEEHLVGRIKGYDVAINAGRGVIGTIDGQELPGEEARAIFNKYVAVVIERQKIVSERHGVISHFGADRAQEVVISREPIKAGNLSIRDKVADILG